MSRKHYQAIAEAIRLNIESKEMRALFAMALVPALKQDNSRFDQNKFITAAVGDWK
jgi:hypothetical protein